MNQQNRLAIFRRDLTGGGCERVLVNLANCLVEKGISIDFLLSKAEGSLLEQVSPQVRVIDLQGKSLDNNQLFKLPTSFQSLTSLPKLVQYLQKEKPQVILAAAHYSNEIAILAKYLSGVATQVIVSEHTTLSQEAKSHYRSSRLSPLMAKLLYPWANGIIAVSHGSAEDLGKITGLSLDKIKVIYNPVITPQLIKQATEPSNHPWFNEGEPPVILGVGRLAPQKDFPSLIQAFAQVEKLRPCRLVILGEGRERKPLQNLINQLGLQDKVALPGFVTNPYAYLAKAAVFVLSSVYEGLPTVLIEAMAVGTPVISTDCESGPREILDNGKYGDLVKVGDVPALTKSILDVLAGNVKSVDSTWLDQFSLESSSQNYLNYLSIFAY
ncbi:MAG: glycosyltransferase [Cyanobacteria bacterium J083]|nr:MAG: glycosyltransferase [Cyanobacteria bacterium J083]